MSQELIISDFSGGMNALAAVDKLDKKECLLAENVRLDETGDILSAGAFTRQNASPYAAAGGTNPNNVHSTYWNPSFGGVAGVGQDVFAGPTLGGLTSRLAGANAMNQKMSFASAPNRVYFDVGSVGYWTDLNNLLTVDWPPPASFASTAGPSYGGAVATAGTGPGWTNIIGILSTTSSPATVGIGTKANSNQMRVTMTTNSFAVGSTVTGIVLTVIASTNQPSFASITVSLLKSGVPVGTPKTQSVSGGLATLTFGSSVDLWGTTWLASEVNSGTFGYQITANNSFTGANVTVGAEGGQLQIYGGNTGTFAGTGTTGTLTGTYTWKITFGAANGEESDGSGDTAAVVLSAQQGTLTAIPTGDARTTVRNIYRFGGALTSHYLVGTINDNTSTTYSDNLSDLAALTAGSILAGDVPGDFPNSRLGGTNVRFPVYHYDRTFWVNQNQTNQILWSKPLNGFAYPVINTIDVGDSKPVIRLVSIFGELIIFKTDSIWRLTGTDETSFDLTQTPSAVGTDEPFTIVALPDKIIFANRYGLWVFNGYTSQPLTTKLDLWFKQDDRTGKSVFGVSGFRPPEVVSATVPANFDAAGNSEKFYFAYAEKSQTQNNALLVFDVKHGNLTKREPGTPLPLSLAIDPVNGYVYMGDAQGFISLLDDWNGASAAGSPLNFDFQYGYTDLQRGSNKVIHALEFYLNTNGQALTPFVYYDNGLASETLAPITTSGLQRVVRTLTSTASKKMQNFSWRLQGTLSSVNISGTPQIQVVSVKPYFDIRTGRSRTGQ